VGSGLAQRKPMLVHIAKHLLFEITGIAPPMRAWTNAISWGCPAALSRRKAAPTGISHSF